jgi:hypothetical protein
MVLANELMRGSHLPDNIQYDGRLGPWCEHFDDESWRGSSYAILAESAFCVSILCHGPSHFHGANASLI